MIFHPRWHDVAAVAGVGALPAALLVGFWLGDVDASGAGARPFPAAFTVTAAAVTTLQLNDGAGVTSLRCLVTSSATPLFLVDPTAATTATGEGPYCADCLAGPIFAAPTARAYARTSSGSAAVRCSFFDASGVAVQAGGGGGLSAVVADGTYLRLDASNDPMTGQLSLLTGTAVIPGLAFDSNTGLFSPVDNEIDFSANGIVRASINTSVMLVGPGIGGNPNMPTVAAGPTVPAYSFQGDTDSGYYRIDEDLIGAATAGVQRWDVGNAAVTASVPRRGAAGSSVVPAYSFTLDTSLGLYRPGVATLGVAVSGVERWRWFGSQYLANTGGSAAAPLISAVSDADSGFFKPGANEWALSTNGIQRWSVAVAAITSTLPQHGASGTAANPGYAYAADPGMDSGAYLVAADTLGWSTSATHRMSLTNTALAVDVDIEQPEVSSGSPMHIRPGAVVNNNPAKPSCSDATEGSIIYVDDANDLLPGGLCSCNADAARAVFDWFTMTLLPCP